MHNGFVTFVQSNSDQDFKLIAQMHHLLHYLFDHLFDHLQHLYLPESTLRLVAFIPWISLFTYSIKTTQVMTKAFSSLLYVEDSNTETIISYPAPQK